MNPTEWKIVPVDPDMDMRKAADRAHFAGGGSLATFKAMIAATPPSPFVMVAREDLLLVIDAAKGFSNISDDELAAANRLTQALETPPQRG